MKPSTSGDPMAMPASPTLHLPADAYLNTVMGAWVGKFVGGTLGAPIEGFKTEHRFTADLSPAGIAENDDTDLQLLWLHALEEHGPGVTPEQLVAEWREHVRAPWNEYGIAAANWQTGVLPPESGRLNNWFWGECMGCPIRSEIWGMICPGAPALAARYAAADGSIDHFGEAVEAEKFFAAIEAALFFEKDIEALISIGLAHIESTGRLARLVADVREWRRRDDWQMLRQRVLTHYGHPEMTHSLQNVGFTLIGLLFGQGDFGRTLAITLNCGYDADCTAATAGAILGGILGHDGIPKKFREAVPGSYRVSEWMLGFPRTGSIRELSVACCRIGREVAVYHGTGVELPASTTVPAQRLAVACVPEVAPPASAENRFPTWAIYGPFWRPWDERLPADVAAGEHGAASLPSVHYFSHNQSGFDVEFLDPATLEFKPIAPTVPFLGCRRAQSDLLPLDALTTMQGPCCFYLTAAFTSPVVTRVWLMAGTTGPIAVWLNGQPVLRSESYQPLTPTTFPVDTMVVSGVNRLVIKLARTSQPLGAFIAFKRNIGAHWHQTFYEVGFNWLTARDAGSSTEPIRAAQPSLFYAC